MLDVIRGAGGGGGGKGGSPSESPNTLQSDSIASVVLLLSEGECAGLPNGLRDVYFSFSGKASDAVPVQNPDGSYNFNGVNAIFTPGTPDQDPLPGFPQVQTVVNVGQQIVYAAPFVTEITDPDADSVIITLQIPALYEVDSKGNVNQNSVGIEIDVQPDGGSYTTALSTAVTGKTSSAYQVSYNIPLQGSAPWNVRVKRTSGDSVTVNSVNDTYMSSYTINQDYALSYPDSCLLGLQVDARLFGTQIPTVFCLLQGVQWQIPANYNPTARSYATSGAGTTGGVWDGTFATAWTNNPAWVLYGLVTNPRFGLGQYVDTSLIDKFGLYAIAQYCDELVPDGAGGQEPRYVYNGVIASQADALKALQTIASSFRGMAFWGPQGVMVSADMPADPVKLVTPANVTGGLITYSGTGQKAIHTVCLVDWANPDLNYQKDTQVVETPNLDDIARFGWRPITITAAGCTSRGQANRMGRWLLYTERLQSETAVWSASWDEADLMPGEIASVADPAYAGARFGGRVLSINVALNSVTIDAPITLESGQTYTFLVALPDGSIGEANILNGPGSASVLTLEAPLPQTPVSGAMWQINSSELEPRQFTCIVNKETDKHLFEITALLHDPDIYDLVEQDITLEPAIYTLLPSGALPGPTNLSVLPGTSAASGVALAQTIAILSWTSAPDPRITQYEAQITDPTGTLWQPSVFSTGSSVDFLNLAQGTYNFRVRSVSSAAGTTTLTSSWVVLDDVTLDPPTVTVAPGAVAADSLAINSVTTAALAAGAVTAAALANGAVTAPAVAAASITAAALANGAVTAPALATGSVTAAALASAAVTATNLANAAVTAPAIASAAVSAAALASGAVTAPAIAANAVTAPAIAASAVTANAIAANAVTAGNISAGAVTASAIAANAIVAGAISAGAVTASAIAANAVEAGAIAAGAIDATDIIVDNIIVTGHLQADTATSLGYIAGSTVTTTLPAGQASYATGTVATLVYDVLVGNVLIDCSFQCVSTAGIYIANANAYVELELLIDGAIVRTAYVVPTCSGTDGSANAVGTFNTTVAVPHFKNLSTGNHTFVLNAYCWAYGQSVAVSYTLSNPQIRILESLR